MDYRKRIFARELRKDLTDEERKVWEALRNRRFENLKFKRQHVIEGFVVDFYCNELKLAIEIDGKVHQKQKNYDELRQCLIEDKGIRFIRITNEEINIDVKILLNEIKSYTTSPLPSN